MSSNDPGRHGRLSPAPIASSERAAGIQAFFTKTEPVFADP
ncbi:MAG: hypothetical protein U0359_00335 [Byssovorax sp.]